MKMKRNNPINVLLYSKNSGTKKLIKSACGDKNITLVDTKKKTDLYAYDYRVAFIGRELFDDDLIETMNEIAAFEKPGDWDIIILGGKPENIPAPLRLYCKGLNNIDEAAIAKIIDKHLPKDKMPATSKTNNDIFKKRIHRIVFLYHLINQGNTIDKTDLCEQFSITERTLFRDLKVLRELFPEQQYYFEQKVI